MNKEQRKRMVESYQEKPREMGVYSITNLMNGRRLIGSSTNLEGAWNRERFGLELGTHENKELQADWNEYGSEAFRFEVLEKLKTEEKLTHDYKDVLNPAIEGQGVEIMRRYRKEVAKKEKSWIEQLDSFVPNGYNVR
jgi:hypothetical protein